MEPGDLTITELRTELANAPEPTQRIVTLAQQALSKANGNAGHNTYLWRDPSWTIAEAQRISSSPANKGGQFNDGRPSLWGIPISVKDCFDLASTPTSCGTTYYRELNGIANQDSWLVEHLRQSGAVITGKTHLHPLAYGITGENPDYGDCVQPRDPTALTGGSSSGAAASVLEGSAMAAIGTDTGGSIRVPAALCGLVGYRSSLGRGNWRGGAHLAPSFDTMGWLFRFLEDASLLASVFTSPHPTPSHKPTKFAIPTKFAVIDPSFLHDCEPAVVKSLAQSKSEFESLGLTATVVDVSWWADSIEIFTAIQASEAAQIHHGNFAGIEPSIRQRLDWGASLTSHELSGLHQRHATFRDRMDDLLAHHELLLLPSSPVARLDAGADHSHTRTRLLRYTSPISLAGMPAIAIPFFENNLPAGGTQLIAARDQDSQLLWLAAALGRQRRSHP